MLHWLPDKLTLLSTSLITYACAVLEEAGAMDRLYIHSMVTPEDRLVTGVRDDSVSLRAPSRAPPMPRLNSSGGRAFVPPLKPRATYLDKADLVSLLTTRGGPLQGRDSRCLGRILESPAKTARLGYLCCLRAVRHEGMSGPPAEYPTVPRFHSVSDYVRWRKVYVADEPRDNRPAVPVRPYESSTFSKSLVLIALGSFGMQLQYRCAKCYRLAAPELKRCPVHSQADAASVEGGLSLTQRRAAARAGDRVALLVGDVGPARDLQTARRSRASQLFGAIFDQPIGDPNEWRAKVQEAVLAATTVRALLPSKFDPTSTRAALRSLRACLDPFEYDPWAWPSKIQHADKWLKHQERVTPGRPPSGPQRKSIERIAFVRELRAKGLDDEAIAKELKITTRALRLTFQRHDTS